ncbi:putative transcriptional regulator [Methylobacterium sp. R2-1]|nr:putative transcriptional regulator [Methylobacterium sp. R2-1]
MIVMAYVRNHTLPAEDLPGLIADVQTALTSLAAPAAIAIEVEKPTPAQIKKSISPAALISFVDGKPYKTLRRHLSHHGLDPHSYRVRYGLPADYPMTSPEYSEQRAAIARATSLGRQRRTWPAKAAE